MHPLQLIGCLITALAIVYLWVEIVGGYLANRTRKRGAKRFVRDYRQLLNLPYEYAPIDAADAKLHHLDAFDEARNDLAAEGFTQLADLENVTHSRVRKARTFARFLASEDGHVLAHCYQDRIPSREEEAVFVDFFSVLDNNVVVETAIDTGVDKSLAHPNWHKAYESSQTNVWELLNFHRNRLRDHLGEHDAVAIRPIRDSDALIAALGLRDQMLKEIVDQRDLMTEQLHASSADPQFIDEVNRQRRA